MTTSCPTTVHIDPTAMVAPDAELAENVFVGPGCVVESNVKVGSGTQLIGRVWLRGPLCLGRNNTIYPNATIGFEPQDLKYDPSIPGAGVTIGDQNVLREGVTIHRATSAKPTTIGNRNYLMTNSHVGHDAQLGDDIMLSSAATLGGHVQVEDRAVLGGVATIHQFCRIGRLACVSGLVGLSQDLPPFCTSYSMRSIGSLNLVGLRRAGYRQHIGPLKQAFDIIFRRSLSNTSAARAILAELPDNPLCVELARFIESSQRGITRYYDSSNIKPEN